MIRGAGRTPPSARNPLHSPDENLRVGNYLDGIQSFLAVITEPIPD